jgi:hypothetical protein
MNSTQNDLFFQPETVEEIIQSPVDATATVERNALDLLMNNSSEQIYSHIDQLYTDQGMGVPNPLEAAARAVQIYEPPRPISRHYQQEPEMVELVPQEEGTWEQIPAEGLLPTNQPNPRVGQRPEKRIVYPVHPKKTNGISFIRQSDSALFATHRMAGIKPTQVPFGLEGMEQTDDPTARLVVYLSMPGVFENITTCARHKKDFQTDQMMELFFQGTNAGIEQVQINGTVGLAAPITRNIVGDNNQAYQLQFNCLTSCQTKPRSSKKLFLNYAVISGNNVIWTEKVQLFVTKNPGRDCDKEEKAKSAVKRKSDESAGSSLPVKRENLDDPGRFLDETPMIAPAAREMIESELAHLSPEVRQRVIRQTQAQFHSLLKTNINLAKEEGQ